MNKNILFGLAVATLIFTAGIASVNAFWGGFGQGHGPVAENHQAVIQAIEAGNYQAWQEAVGDHPMSEKITPENFSKLQEMNNLKQKRDQLKQELGLASKNKFGLNNQNREAIEAALEAGNYQAWQEAVGSSCPFSDKITQENFSQLIEAHRLMENGQRQEANQIREELGLNLIKGKGMSRGQFNK